MSLSCLCVGPYCFSPRCPECHDYHKVCDLQVQNAAPPAAPGQVNGQAVAVLLANDKAAFYGCGFYGGQDTLFDYSGRHYFKDCYFEGNIDIISGNGQSVFKVQPCIITFLLSFMNFVELHLTTFDLSMCIDITCETECFCRYKLQSNFDDCYHWDIAKSS